MAVILRYFTELSRLGDNAKMVVCRSLLSAVKCSSKNLVFDKYGDILRDY